MTGKNKKNHYPVLKSIRISIHQANKWNPALIRDFLDNETIYNTNEISVKQEINNIHQPLYQVKKGTNIIKKLDKIHEDLVNNMNILKLNTYPEEIRNHCIYIMKESNGFLQNQLKPERDKGVIIIQAKETNKTKILMEKNLNKLTGDFNTIAKYRKHIEKTILLFRKERISIYSLHIQEVINQMNYELEQFHKKQNIRKFDKEVIEIEENTL